MLRPIFKILPFFLIKMIAKRYAMKMNQGAVDFYFVFKDTLIKVE